MVLKTEFSIATATYFKVILFCSDLICKILLLSVSVRRGYHISKDNNRKCYVTSVLQDNKKCYVTRYSVT